MNREYFYSNGTVLVVDENNEEKIVEYYDNLDDVLVKENVIETIENEISKLEREIPKYPKKSKIEKVKDFITTTSLFILLPLIAVFGISRILNINTVITTSLFGTMKLSTFISMWGISASAILGGIVSLILYTEQKEEERVRNGKETQLKYLKQALNKQKEALKSLSENKTNTQQQKEFYISKVNAKEDLKKLKKELELYYNLGYNEENYLKYYKKGNLNEHIPNKDIQLANNHFKEKTLIKKI